ncbi:MAG: hypothetical protein GKS06_17205 [Acidobacteria bacterium]|nr:hypothetical protein [Acidobacteriota bacterium]
MAELLAPPLDETEVSTPSQEEEVRIEARLRQLERRFETSQRSLPRAAACGFVLLSMFVLIAANQAAGRVTETEALVIRDQTGTVRAQLGVGEEGAALGLFDERGFLRIRLAASPEGPILNLFSSDGNPRIVVGERGESAFVILRDVDGAPRAAMAIQADGTPSLYLLDETMAPLWRQPAESVQR